MELPSDPEDTEGESQSLLMMVPDEAGDLWLAYNLIAEGDTVQAVTVRNVPSEAASGGRDTEAAERVKLKLEIKVEPILSSCLDLESTNLERCSLLVTRLVFVHSYCYEVMEIGLSAANLTAFEYGGNLVKFFLGSSKSGKAPFLGSQRL